MVVPERLAAEQNVCRGDTSKANRVN